MRSCTIFMDDYLYSKDKPEPVELQTCDVCGNDEEDFRKAFGGYCCVDCLGSDRVLPYYLNEHDNIEEVYEWYENLKLK